MKIKSRIKVTLFEENSDADQHIIVIVDGDFLSSQDCIEILKDYPVDWHIGGYEILETYLDLTK
jgi:hypothetical protein